LVDFKFGSNLAEIDSCDTGPLKEQRWAAQHFFQFRNTQFHSFVIVVRKTQLRSVSKSVSALCAMPQLRILPLRTITVRKKIKLQNKKNQRSPVPRRLFIPALQ
jgi:hypothetical protein